MKKTRGNLLLTARLVMLLALISGYSFAEVYQPDSVYYSLNREELFGRSEENMKTFPVRWIVASAKEGEFIYDDSSLSQVKFQAPFLQRFEVLAKEKANLKVRELDKSNLRTGWVNMKNLIYLPRSLKDGRTGVYQKVVFTHKIEDKKPETFGGVRFYKTPHESANYKDIPMGTTYFSYVYAWQGNKYEDSQFVLIGNYPSIEGVVTNKNAFREVIYGWCKTSRVFPWSSRMALIPNPDTRYPTYIFKTGPSLRGYYQHAGITDAPPSDLLLKDSPQKWIPGSWPFIVDRKVEDYLSLFCQAEVEDSEKTSFGRFLSLRVGYAKEVDPRSPKIQQFKNLYLFRRDEAVRIIVVLNSTLNLLKPASVAYLWEVLIKRLYGEDYASGRTFNDYAKMHDGITYQNLSLLFDRTQEQILRMQLYEFEEIERKLLRVRERLKDLLNDTTSRRFFGPKDDPYIWLFEDELP